HQPYAGNTPDGVDIPPGTTLTVPVDGYCLDVHSPPVPAGEAMPGYESWVQIGDPADLITTYANNHPGLEHLPGLPVGSTFVPAYDPSQAITLINSPAFEPSAPQPATVSLTFPGTDIPITGHFDIHEDPLSTAPLLIAITEVMTDAALTVQQSGSHPTPFAGNPDRELDALTQQGLWIVMGALTGEAYTQEDFQQNTYTQFTENTGQSVDDLPETAKEQLDSGVNDFWDAFTAVGVEAKVLRSEETTAPEAIPINNEEETDLRPRGCPSDMTVNLNPPYDFDMVIAPEWGSAEERRATIDTVRAMLERDLSVTTEDALVTYDINRHPTSSTSFWKGGNIGGFASARAKTWFRTDDGWDWVWGTPRMATHAGGTMDYTLAYTPDEGCSATVAGVALIRVRASSEAFDAMAGNRQDENDTDQLQFLRGTQYIGKKATEWLILRGRGRTTKSFQRFVADDLRDQVEGQITEAIQEEATRLAEQALHALLEEMGLDLDISDIELPDFELPNVKELLEEALGIEIPDIEQWISDGIDAAWNLFF
ncbi:MAG: hypothetical protein KDC54_13645, partial [Lewinella sp.]|nr:hypothetical protein [Lewinella sp.]